MSKLVLAVTGASGSLLAERLMEKSPWPVHLVVSRWGREVYERERGALTGLTARAAAVLDVDDLLAPIASGSVETAGMVVAPCSANTLGHIASGTSPNLITRAAHCHLKEGRRLILALREAPLSLIDLDNARAVAAAGGVVMPLSPPFFMTAGRNPDEVTMTDLMDLFADRVLQLLGQPASQTWEDVR
jgi:4-hydroxy-3-polyprenylbenzoate decarboxylase